MDDFEREQCTVSWFPIRCIFLVCYLVTLLQHRLHKNESVQESQNGIVVATVLGV
jgi:hypothetical protein